MYAAKRDLISIKFQYVISHWRNWNLGEFGFSSSNPSTPVLTPSESDIIMIMCHDVALGRMAFVKCAVQNENENEFKNQSVVTNY